MSFGLQTKIRVISDTTTFYPLEVQEHESHQRNDNMTLLTTITYLKEQLSEDFQFFRAGDLFVVLQQWRGMLFFVETREGFSAELLRFILQVSREMLIFLFGTKFESVMRRNISLSKRQVYSRYVDAFLGLCSKDHRFLLNALCWTNDSEELKHFFLEKNAPVPKDVSVKLLSVLLLESYEIAVHFRNTKMIKLEPETLSLLQIFVKVEFPDIDETHDPTTTVFDPEYVKSGASSKHKSAFLRIERNPVGCTLSCTRCAEKSRYILVVITQNTKMQVEVQHQIDGYMSEMCAFVSQLTAPNRMLSTFSACSDLIHFIAINRTEGDVWEMSPEHCITAIMNYKHVDESEAANQYHKIIRKMASYAFTAMMHGYTTMMWGELDYQFTYAIKFLDDDNEELKPAKVFLPPSFDDDNGVSYNLIVNSVFPGQNDVKCFELLSIYRGSIRPKEAIEANSNLFQEFFKRI